LTHSGREQANHADHESMLHLVEAGKADEAYAPMRGHVTVQGDVLAEFISSAPRPVLQADYE